MQRRIVVECNIRGRDLGSFVAEAQQAVAQAVTLPVGYELTWGGQFEHLQDATRRLAIVVPVTLLLILGMLSVIFGAMRPALLIFLNVPARLVGRHSGPVAPRIAAEHLGHYRLYRPLRHCGAECSRAGESYPPTGSGRALNRPGGYPRRHGSIATGADDGPGGESWISPDGVGDQYGRGGATTAGHSRHRRIDLIDGIDVDCVTCALSVD